MAYKASTINLLTSWLRDWHADGLTDLCTDCLTDWLAEWLSYRLIDWPTCWLTVWPTDWLTDLLTCWETEWLAGRTTDGLSETVMRGLVDCCWPVPLNLQANFLTIFVSLARSLSLFSDWLMMKEIWLTCCLLVQTLLPIMTEWIQGQAVTVTLADWLII